jgi:DNA-binding LacI/PurR family transcriptional regulator
MAKKKTAAVPDSRAALKRPQMADIARMAGVSSSTVSRALSGSNLVNPETRQRIQEVASRYNYTVNRLAMELRSGTNNTIAVVVPYEDHCRQTFADPFFHAMIGALADASTERGYEMLLMRLEANRIDSIAALVDSGRVAGVILIGQWRQHDELNALASRSIPFVVWGAHLEGQRYCCNDPAVPA